MVPDVTGEAAEAAPRLATRLELRQRASGASLGGYRPRGPHGRCWDEAAKACGVDLTWYQATQHSFVSRALRDGVQLDEVSAAVGHSMPVPDGQT
jgi:hypothetical protein